MRVRLRTRMAGPSGVAEPGEEREFPDDIALSLIVGGAATEIPEPKPPVPVATEPRVESAATEPDETATLPEPPRRRRKG